MLNFKSEHHWKKNQANVNDMWNECENNDYVSSGEHETSVCSINTSFTGLKLAIDCMWTQRD